MGPDPVWVFLETKNICLSLLGAEIWIVQPVAQSLVLPCINSLPWKG